jgi:hypothetical protein
MMSEKGSKAHLPPRLPPLCQNRGRGAKNCFYSADNNESHNGGRISRLRAIRLRQRAMESEVQIVEPAAPEIHAA